MFNTLTNIDEAEKNQSVTTLIHTVGVHQQPGEKTSH